MGTDASRIVRSILIGIALFACCLALPTVLAAQSGSQGMEEHVRVVGHLAIPGVHVNEMFVQQRGAKFYLYLHRPAKKAFALVDVTRPNRPVMVEQAAMSVAPRTHVDVDPATPALVIAVAPETQPALTQVKEDPQAKPPRVLLPTETLRFMDLSNPKKPKAIRTFSGVTSFLPDDARHLVYVVNQEGLWIVSHRESRPMPLCTSEDALMQEPNCQ